jgi:hypothetical protein
MCGQWRRSPTINVSVSVMVLVRSADRTTGSTMLSWQPLKLRSSSFPIFDVPVTVLHEVDEHSPFRHMVRKRRKTLASMGSAAHMAMKRGSARDLKATLATERDKEDATDADKAATESEQLQPPRVDDECIDLERLCGGGDPALGLRRFRVTAGAVRAASRRSPTARALSAQAAAAANVAESATTTLGGGGRGDGDGNDGVTSVDADSDLEDTDLPVRQRPRGPVGSGGGGGGDGDNNNTIAVAPPIDEDVDVVEIVAYVSGFDTTYGACASEPASVRVRACVRACACAEAPRRLASQHGTRCDLVVVGWHHLAWAVMLTSAMARTRWH